MAEHPLEEVWQVEIGQRSWLFSTPLQVLCCITTDKELGLKKLRKSRTLVSGKGLFGGQYKAQRIREGGNSDACSLERVRGS